MTGVQIVTAVTETYQLVHEEMLLFPKLSDLSSQEITELRGVKCSI